MTEENLPDDSSIFERLVNQSNSKEERIFGMLAYAKCQKDWTGTVVTSKFK